MFVSEASIRRHLKLEDSDGISTLPYTEIFEQLALIGYVSNTDKLTFQKGHFSPQWRFLIYTILHCLSPKKASWEQFSSNIATAIICLATNRTFNFSKMIFERMLKNLDNEVASTGVDVRHGRAATNVSSLDVGQGSEVAKIHTYTRRRRTISTGSGRISTAEESVSTAGTSMPVSTAGMVDKGKAIMQEFEPELTTTKLQQRQERAGYEADIRLQEQLDDEERQRIARVHEEASSFNVEEWEDIQATTKADEELALRIQAEEREKYFEAKKARLLVDLINKKETFCSTKS
nr:glutamic acid-rich protein-like [Tanacetum cinerariifolium]